MRGISAPNASRDANLVRLVESFRNAEGQPRQRVVVSLGDAALLELEKPAIVRAVETHLARPSIRKPSQPDPKQSLLDQKLRIDWKAAFRPIQSFAKA